MGRRIDGWGLAAGLVLGVGLAVGTQACVLENCGGQEPEQWSFLGGGMRYTYGFDVDRAPFHDDDAIEAGTLEVDKDQLEVVIRYPTSAGEKVETWTLVSDEFEPL